MTAVAPEAAQTNSSAPLRASPAKHMDLERMRPLFAAGMACFGVGLCALFYFLLPDKAAKILIDRNGLIYPFSVQNCMWVVFCVASGELFIRMRSTRIEFQQLRHGYLPSDTRVILQGHDLPEIYRRIQEAGYQRFVPRLISRCILQFQISSSIEQCASLMNTTLDLLSHEVDLRYSMLRYITWLIPSLGFIGTVIGIGHALAFAGEPGRFQDPALLTEVTSRLAVSFDGTLVALLMAAVLLFWQNVVQSKEEHALNLSGQYCLDNLINKLYVPKQVNVGSFLKGTS
jgi:biopolymer transport protein ExbB/TolQ